MSQSPPVGPRLVVYKTCNGCPAYQTDWWKDEEGAGDSGYSSTCKAVTPERGITCYATADAPVPSWCPKFHDPVTSI